MKKLIALLAAASILSAGLCSCGDSEKEDKKDKDNSSKASDTVDNDDDDKDEDEEEKSEEEEKEEAEDKDEEENEDEDEDESDDNDKVSSKSDSDVVGKWKNADLSASTNTEDAGFIFTEDGSISMYMDCSEMMALQKDGSIIASGETIGAEYIDFDGETYLVSDEGMVIIEMKKYEKSSDSDFTGTYNVVGGVFADGLKEGMGDSAALFGTTVDITFDGTATYLIFNDIMSYTISGDYISFRDECAFTGTFGEIGTCTYTIDGNNFTIFSADNEPVLEFTRAK